MHLRGPGPQPLGSLPGGRNAHVLGVMETTAGTPKSPSHTRTPDRNRRNRGEVGGGCVPTCCCCRAKCHQSRGFKQPRSLGGAARAPLLSLTKLKSRSSAKFP